MKRTSDHPSITHNKKIRELIDLIVIIMTIVITICYIIVIKFNHNIAGNLSTDLMREILSFMQHTNNKNIWCIRGIIPNINMKAYHNILHSRYNIIYESLQLKRKRKQCKYKTRIEKLVHFYENDTTSLWYNDFNILLQYYLTNEEYHLHSDLYFHRE